MARYSAVFDVGKTNKKVLIFDDKLKTVASAYETFATDESGSRSGTEHIEQFPEAKEWLFAQLKNFAVDYDIEAISITTHGATIVFIDEAGEVTVPCLAYTSPIPAEIHQQFFEKFGDKHKLHKELATPFLGVLLNYAMCIFYAQKVYARCKHILTLPNYFTHALTGIAAAEPTMAGCHSYKWDFENKTWSYVAEGLGALEKLPHNIKNSYEVMGMVTPALQKELGLPADCKVTYGIHDSNSSLVPYLIDGGKDFVLNSTGTWCVAMSPDKKMQLSDEEIAAQAYYNFGAFGEPIKTAAMMGGCEHDTYVALFKEHGTFSEFPNYDKALYEKVLADASCFIMPGVAPAGPFHYSTARIIDGDQECSLIDIQAQGMDSEHFADSDYMYAALNISLAIQTYANFVNVGLEDGLRIYTEGGFRKNTAYHILIAALCPNNDVVLSNIEEATAFGAALLNTAAIRGCELRDVGDIFELTTEDVGKHQFAGLENYHRKFLEHVKKIG